MYEDGTIHDRTPQIGFLNDANRDFPDSASDWRKTLAQLAFERDPSAVSVVYRFIYAYRDICHFHRPCSFSAFPVSASSSISPRKIMSVSGVRSKAAVVQ
jgi:hypothetical protein